MFWGFLWVFLFFCLFGFLWGFLVWISVVIFCVFSNEQYKHYLLTSILRWMVYRRILASSVMLILLSVEHPEKGAQKPQLSPSLVRSAHCRAGALAEPSASGSADTEPAELWSSALQTRCASACATSAPCKSSHDQCICFYINRSSYF